MSTNCAACRYSFMEPQVTAVKDPDLWCGHKDAGTAGVKTIRARLAPDGHCGVYGVKFEQHPRRTNTGALIAAHVNAVSTIPTTHARKG